MALIQRGDIWWIDLTGVGGKRVRMSTKTSDKKLAEQVHAKKQHELFQEAQLGVLSDRPFSEAADYFLSVKLQLRSLGDYERHVAWWTEQFRRVSLKSIDAGAIVKAIEAKRKEGVSFTTCNRYLAALRAVLRLAYRRHWIISVPLITLYREPKERVRWLNDDEVVRLLGALPVHYRWAAIVALETGLRQSNVLNMRWSWVDLAKRTLTIPAAQFKNGRSFSMPLSAGAVDAIRAQLGGHETYVFVRDGKRFAIESKAWSRALKRAGIEDFRWHDLRHTWASRMAQAGVPTQVLQRLGGWETMSMVNRYAHLNTESLRSFVDAVPITTRLRHNQDKSYIKLVS